jgi:two-component system chemotaxis sensor kinase CheA
MGDEEAMHMIFSSGFSTSTQVDEVSGRGVGLDVVRSSLELIQGRVTVKSQPGAGTQFRIAVPITLAVVSSLLVAAGGQRFALPMHAVVSVLPPEPEQRWAGGRPIVLAGTAPVPLADLAATLGLDAAPTNGTAGPTVLLAGHTEQHAFSVKQVLGQRQVVVKSLSPVLPRLPAVVGASVEPDGPILLLLEATALIERALEGRPRTTGSAPAPGELEVAGAAGPASRILVVDDARIVREVERSILEQAGYDVVTASDGMEALAELSERGCDLVVSDVEMPRMDGLELTSRIRAMPRLAQLPVILLTSRPDEETRRRGLEAGADGYVVKSAFDRLALIGMVEKALGH